MSQKRSRWFIFLFTLLFTFTVLTAGCANEGDGGSENGGSAEAEKVLVIGYDRDAEILDTIKTAWYSDALIYIHDRLVSRDYDFNYQPGLAKSWEPSEDGLAWTFKLKEGVKFHDGTPLKASDVKFTIESIIDPEVASPSASDLAAIKGVEVKDDLTFDIVLKHPFPNLLF